MKTREKSEKVVTHPKRKLRRERALARREQNLVDYDNGNWSMFANPLLPSFKYARKLTKSQKKEKVAICQLDIARLSVKLTGINIHPT